MNPLAMAWQAFELEEFARAEQLFRKARLEPVLAADARMGLVYVFARTGRFDEARDECGLLRLEAQSTGNLAAEYVALHQLGMVERMAENFVIALEIFAAEAKIILQLENPPLAVSANAYEQGMICGKLGQLEEARTWLGVALEQAQLSGDAIAEACAFRGLGELAANPTMRKAMLLQSLAAFERGEDPYGVAEIQDLLEQQLH